MCKTTHLQKRIWLLQRLTISFHWTHKAPQFYVTRDLQQKSNCSSYQESYLHLAIDWDPQKVQFPSHHSDRVVSNTSAQCTCEPCLHRTTYDPEHFSSRIIQQVHVDWRDGEQNPAVRQGIPSARTFQSRERHLRITPADISEQWYVGLSQANNTLNATTQRLVCSALPDRYRYAQVFANVSFFAVSYPMEKNSSAGQALKQFIAEFGIPDRIVCDGLGEQTGKRTEIAATVTKHGIDLHLTEPD